MRLLVVNPNTSDSVTRLIEAEARRSASPGTEIVVAQVRCGMAYIETRFESLIAAEATAQILAEHGAECDAVVVAAFGDPGMPALKELLDVPVVGITEAALALASLAGPRMSILAISQQIVPWYRDAVERSGMIGRLASIRALGEELRDIATVQQDHTDAFLGLADEVVAEDGADVIILAGAPLAGLARAVGHRMPAPTIDGVFAGIRMAEVLVGAGLGGTLAAPPTKPVKDLSPVLQGALSRRQQKGNDR